jgi:hypothetical protein
MGSIWGGEAEIIQVSVAKCTLKRHRKNLEQINEKCNICSADENKHKNTTAEPLFKSYKKTIYLFTVRRLRSCTCF